MGNLYHVAYNQYKHNTNDFIHWLETTAPKHGYVSAGREDARVQRFIDQAQVIVRSRVVVPEHIRTAAQRAIEGRKLQAQRWQWWKPDHVANAKHAHFIDVLGEALAILVAA